MIASSEQPPPLTRGKRFRPSTDDEADPPSCGTDTADPQSSGTVTTHPQSSGTDTASIAHQAQPKIVQHSLNELCDIASKSDTDASAPAALTNERLIETVSRKRSVRTEEPSSPIKRTKTSSSDFKRLEYFDAPSESSTTSTPTTSKTQLDPKQSTSTASSLKCYSELRYLEAIGSIRTIRRSKHPGINKLPTTSTHTEMVTTTVPLISPESQNGWDRKTKLKLSYRIGNTTNDIQFALIIYEPLTMVTRRNLLEEFQLAAEDEANRCRSVKKSHPRTNKTKAKATPLKSDKLLSLRRLRF